VKHTKADGTPIHGTCPNLLRAPFVCNPCGKKRSQCAYQRQFYYAKPAQQAYETLLVEAREGIALNKQTFYEGDAILTAGVKKGQRLYHITATQNVGFSQSSAYRNLHRGYLSISKTDLPRQVKFKPRRQYRATDAVPKAVRLGRTYEDFKEYIEAQNIKHWVEMDTVIGRIGGKAIMTFDFTFCNFMFGLLMDNKTAAEAALRIRVLKTVLCDGGVRFGDIFSVILTDNGGEFANVAAFTDDLDGGTESRLYFCDPYQSSQKPRVEKNHTLFRDIVPKGQSFDGFTQDTVNMIFSHVNSTARKVLNGKTPYEMFTFMYGEAVAALLGIVAVPAVEVVQSPLLLKRAAKTIKTPPADMAHTPKGMPNESKGCF
jgi:IS30 family transposase